MSEHNEALITDTAATTKGTNPRNSSNFINTDRLNRSDAQKTIARGLTPIEFAQLRGWLALTGNNNEKPFRAESSIKTETWSGAQVTFVESPSFKTDKGTITLRGWNHVTPPVGVSTPGTIEILVTSGGKTVSYQIDPEKGYDPTTGSVSVVAYKDLSNPNAKSPSPTAQSSEVNELLSSLLKNSAFKREDR